MNVAGKYPAEEGMRPHDAIDDLANVMALPDLRTGGEPAEIVSSLLDVLVETLSAGFICIRLNHPEGEPSLETARVAEWLHSTTGIREITEAIDSSLGDAPSTWPERAQIVIQDVDLSVAWTPLGLGGEIGVVVVGSARSDFPTQTEKLVLEITASRTTIGLQHARHLRETENRSRSLMDSIPGLVALLSVGGEVQFVNRQIIEYTGRTLEELKHWGTDDTVHPEDLPHVIQTFTQSITSGRPYGIVQRLRRSDGAYLWFQNDGFPLRDASGQIVSWCVLLTNIDERTRTEVALRESERYLKLIIDTIPALAWSARPDGTAEFFNKHYLDFIGLSAEQASGWGWTTAVHPEDLNDLAVTWQRIMASEAPGQAEARMRRHDGEYLWLLFRANPLRDETGVIVTWYGVNTVIEDQKRAEVELRRAYDSFADAQRLSKTGNFTADIVADDHIWSAELYRIFEIDPATRITVQTVRDIIHPEDLPAFDAGFARSLGGVDFDQVFRIIPASQNVKHVHAVGHFIERVAGRPLFIGAIQDVTESIVAEEALNRIRSEFAHVARVTTVSALTASIAHEINQPLSGIITNSSTCLRMLDADPSNVEGARETVRRTIRDGNRVSDVITRLRALFSRREFTFELLDLNAATRDVIALALNDLQHNRVTLQSELANDLPLVTGDRIQLQQVILNLLRNASDAMVDVHDRPRQLLIKTERENGDRVCLTVRDAGQGLSPQSLDSLFDPFYTTKSGGMGIGLYVSRSIVERHHGRLWAAPNDGGPGTTFAFSIPRDAESIMDAPPPMGPV